LYAILVAGEQPVSCGLGVLDGDCFGLFDLVTAPAARNRAFGAGARSPDARVGRSR
jgi:hypothetical protein